MNHLVSNLQDLDIGNAAITSLLELTPPQKAELIRHGYVAYILSEVPFDYLVITPDATATTFDDRAPKARKI